MKKLPHIIIPLLLLAGMIFFRYFFSEKIETLQLRVFDFYQAQKPRIYQDLPVKIADIDEISLQKLGQWPWPRTILAGLVNKLTDAGAAVIVFDIIFSEEDRSSPRNMLAFWGKSVNKEKILSLLPVTDHDQVFAAALAAGNAVASFSLTDESNAIRPELKERFNYMGEDPLQFLHYFRGAVINIPAIEKSLAGNGSFNILPEKDGLIRRVPLLYRLENELYPSLAAEALRAAQGAKSYIVKSSGASGVEAFGEKTGINSVKIGQFSVPTDAQGRIWLYDTGHRSERFLPVWKIMENQLPAAELAGKIIFVGTSASGLKDLRNTPLQPFAPGVEVHVQLVEQMLTGEFLNRPDYAEGAEIIFILVIGILLTVLMTFTGALWCALIGMAGIAGVFIFSWQAFTRHHLLFDPVIPSVTVLVIYLAAALIHYLRTESEKNKIRHAFTHYLSPALVEKLASQPNQLRLGGEIKNMTVLFSDIQGFTGLAEKFSPEELTRFMNLFLTPMTEIILNHNGTIDKYMGDCIMAFWNAPFDEPLHAQKAAAAALAMQERLHSLNESMKTLFPEKDFGEIEIGIGINTGDCCVGNMGSEQRFDYTVLGDEVNLASRLENLTRSLSQPVIIGENTYQLISAHYACLELDIIRVKGKSRASRIYALLGGKQILENKGFQELSQAQGKIRAAYLNQQWQETLTLLESLRKNAFYPRLDSFYAELTRKVKRYQIHPPEEGWDGISVSLSK